MGIQFARSYQASDGKCYSTLMEAQKVEIEALLSRIGGEKLTAKEAAELIVNHSEKFMDVLSTTETSRPKARAVNGGRKPRKKTTTTVTAETQPPSYIEANRVEQPTT